jgi:hypothetical protein
VAYQLHTVLVNVRFAEGSDRNVKQWHSQKMEYSETTVATLKIKSQVHSCLGLTRTPCKQDIKCNSFWTETEVKSELGYTLPTGLTINICIITHINPGSCAFWTIQEHYTFPMPTQFMKQPNYTL